MMCPRINKISRTTAPPPIQIAYMVIGWIGSASTRRGTYAGPVPKASSGTAPIGPARASSQPRPASTSESPSTSAGISTGGAATAERFLGVAPADFLAGDAEAAGDLGSEPPPFVPPGMSIGWPQLGHGTRFPARCGGALKLWPHWQDTILEAGTSSIVAVACSVEGGIVSGLPQLGQATRWPAKWGCAMNCWPHVQVTGILIGRWPLSSA